MARRGRRDIRKTQSHGRIRLTNWDAAELAGMSGRAMSSGPRIRTSSSHPLRRRRLRQRDEAAGTQPPGTLVRGAIDFIRAAGRAASPGDGGGRPPLRHPARGQPSGRRPWKARCLRLCRRLQATLSRRSSRRASWTSPTTRSASPNSPGKRSPSSSSRAKHASGLPSVRPGQPDAGCDPVLRRRQPPGQAVHAVNFWSSPIGPGRRYSADARLHRAETGRDRTGSRFPPALLATTSRAQAARVNIAKGDAIDVVSFVLADKRRVTVKALGPPCWAPLRMTPGGYFTTVLGPGAGSSA